jgi:hypothetical protein
MESILQYMKNRRLGHRTYKLPFMKEKKKRVMDFKPLEELRLMSTPGLPDVNEEAIADDQVLISYTSFRRETLLRYLESSQEHTPELKAKLLDWKPEVLENKTRHQTTKAREVTAYKEIFGSELPGIVKKPKTGHRKKAKPTDEQQQRQPKQETPKTAEKPPRKAPKKAKKANGTAPEAVVVPPGRVEPEPDKATSTTEAADAIDEEGPISEAAEELQTELQTYALDLLDGNASWERKKVIQNLVIWEPVTDPTLLAMPSNAVVPGTVSGSSVSVNVQSASPSSRKGKNKKVRKRQSGLDFNRKRSMGKGSRDVSRAHSPVQSSEDQSSKEVIHTLANVMTDSRHMVLDRSAGETILHRAAKMGYPDVTAYALDMAKMSAVVKDNAGFPPLHKAALKGHAEIVDYLIR